MQTHRQTDRPNDASRRVVDARTDRQTQTDRLTRTNTHAYTYGVALMSRIDKIIGLFCKRALNSHYILHKRRIILRSLLTVATP